MYEQNFWRTNNIGTSIELPKDVKLYKNQNKRQAFPETFWLESMTIFTAHDCRLITTFGTKRIHLFYLKAIAVELHLEIKNNGSSGCYNIEQVLSLLPRHDGWSLSIFTFLFN